MARIYFAVVQGGALVGDFDILEGVDLAGDVRSLKQRLQASRSRLRDVELDDMMVFGPWEAKPPKAAEWKKKLTEDDAALAPNVTLPSLIGATGDYLFIVRITAPPLAAATGGLVLAELLAKQAQQDTMLAQQGTMLAKLEAQQAIIDAEILPVLQKGLFTVLDVEDLPICCGFFVTESGVALTVRHEHVRWLRPGGIVHAVMLKDETLVSGGNGGSAAASGDEAPYEVRLTFQVHSFALDSDLDYTCMKLTSSVPTGTFRALTIPAVVLPNKELIGRQATLLHGSIAYNRLFQLDPSASLVACSIFTAHSRCVLYTAATAGGDSGGALVLSGKVLIAMHIEGVNDVPSDLEVTSPSAGKGGRAKKFKLSEASPSTTAAAMRLDLPEIRAAIQAANDAVQSAAAAAVGGKL